MPILYRPKAGEVLMCDFKGYQTPEMIKTRPVVVISPNHLPRPGLVTVVPLSTTEPAPVEPYHYQLLGNPVPGVNEVVWAKCDMLASVGFWRLDRIKVSRGIYAKGHVSMDQVREIRLRCGASFGLDIAA